MSFRFSWDHRKAAINRRRHGVSFDEASTVFDDPLAIVFDDDSHSTYEERALIIGHSISGRLLFVSFTERPGGILHLISARTVTQKERRDYEENTHA